MSLTIYTYCNGTDAFSPLTSRGRDAVEMLGHLQEGDGGVVCPSHPTVVSGTGMPKVSLQQPLPGQAGLQASANPDSPTSGRPILLSSSLVGFKKLSQEYFEGAKLQNLGGQSSPIDLHSPCNNLAITFNNNHNYNANSGRRVGDAEVEVEHQCNIIGKKRLPETQHRSDDLTAKVKQNRPAHQVVVLKSKYSTSKTVNQTSKTDGAKNPRVFQEQEEKVRTNIVNSPASPVTSFSRVSELVLAMQHGKMATKDSSGNYTVVDQVFISDLLSRC
jgi:hypothetical protein